MAYLTASCVADGATEGFRYRLVPGALLLSKADYGECRFHGPRTFLITRKSSSTVPTSRRSSSVPPTFNMAQNQNAAAPPRQLTVRQACHLPADARYCCLPFGNLGLFHRSEGL
ncbi:hypothetical protein CB1_000548022 [Camelus ferus]|nr:hypothetical protein CB1_000548022 [Camelus ferus]